jgi:hypothetical protein
MAHLPNCPPRLHCSPGGLALGLLAATWCAAIVAGLALVVDFETKPGASSPQITRWPAKTQLAPAVDGATLVMFLHPECPCSRASLDELDRLLQSNSAPIKVHLVIVAPSEGPDWRQATNAARAARIGGAILSLDSDGETARQFGAETSGDVFVFDRSGQLRFQGGITAARGHSGPNAASAAAAAAMREDGTGTSRMPVFGCSLF